MKNLTIECLARFGMTPKWQYAKGRLWEATVTLRPTGIQYSALGTSKRRARKLATLKALDMLTNNNKGDVK